MTVSSVNVTAGPFAGNDVVDEFSFTFPISDKTEIVVYQTDGSGAVSTLELTTDYTVAGVGDESGGSITLVAGALPTGYSLFITASFLSLQSTSFTSQSAFYAALHEAAFDALTRMIQQSRNVESRALQFHPTDSSSAPVLPSSTTRSDTVLGFDANGDIELRTDLPGKTVSETPVAGAVPLFKSDGSLEGTNIIHSITNRAALRDTPVTTGVKSVYLKGVTAERDGGEGFFAGVTGAAPATYVDNGGTIIVPTGSDGSSAWLRLHGDTLNIAAFGAPNGGSSDAYDDLVKINALTDVKTVVFTGGIYRVGTSLAMDKNFILLAGAEFKLDTGVEFYTTGQVNGLPGTDLIILAGQSNAAGSADNVDLDPDLNRNWDNCKIWNGSTFTTMGTANNRAVSASEHGCEFELARQYAKRGRRLYLVKYGVGGSSLDYRDSGNTWYPYRGDNNKGFFEYVKNALGYINRENLSIKLAWVQGEADSNSSATGMAYRYEANLIDLFDQMLQWFGPVQITVARTNINIAPGTYTNTGDVQDGQENAVSMIAHAGWIDTDDLELQGDVLHFTSDGYSDLAIKFYNVFSQNIVTSYESKTIPLWERKMLINPRDEGAGATALATIVSGTSVDNATSTGLGVGFHLTGTASYGTGAGASTIALASVDTFPDSNIFEADVEIVSGSGGVGGFLFCVNSGGTYIEGYFVRITGGEIRLYKVDFTNAAVQLGSTYSATFVTDKPVRLRAKSEKGTVTVWYKQKGSPWTVAVDVDDSDYTSGELFITSGWGGTDEEGIRFGNIECE